MPQVNGYGLSDMALTFAIHYAASLKPTESAIKAGYSKKCAKQTAQTLLKKPAVKAFIQNQTDLVARKATVTKQDLLEKLAYSLRRNLWDFEDGKGFVVSSLKQIPREDHCFIDGFEVFQHFDEDGNIVSQKIKVKLSPNAAVQDMVAKHLGAYAPVETKGETKMTLDWNSLNGKPDEQEEDMIEGQIQELLTEESGEKEDGDG